MNISPLQMKLAGVLLVSLAAVSTVLYVRHLKNELADVTAQKVQVETQLNLQNAAIKQMKADSDAREAAAKEAIAQAKAQADATRAKATVIYKTSPSKPGDLCSSALDLINGSAK